MRPAYAGIGARKTPESILNEMKAIAIYLQATGYVLRSGGAIGADTAFEHGAGIHSEIYRAHDANPDSLELAARFHPAWHRCSPQAKKLMARNGFQVLGRDLVSPSRFIVCWTADGKASGGTGQAIRIAEHYGIPVFNLHDKTAPDRLAEFLSGVPA